MARIRHKLCAVLASPDAVGVRNPLPGSRVERGLARVSWCAQAETVTPWRLITFAELDSTNRYARLHLRELQHGDVIHAEVQTSGRGRLNRSWLSHVPGNLCLSLVIKPETSAVSGLPLVNLSQLLALVTCRALDAFKVDASLKWPNDIQIGGRKVAGILAETVTQGADFLGLVLGIGVNVNLEAQSLDSIDQPATAVNQVLGHPVDPARVRDTLLHGFFGQYATFMTQGFRATRDEFLSRCNFLGKPIEVSTTSGLLHGTAADVDGQGALVLEQMDGSKRIVEIGEMFARS